MKKLKGSAGPSGSAIQRAARGDFRVAAKEARDNGMEPKLNRPGFEAFVSHRLDERLAGRGWDNDPDARHTVMTEMWARLADEARTEKNEELASTADQCGVAHALMPGWSERLFALTAGRTGSARWTGNAGTNAASLATWLFLREQLPKVERYYDTDVDAQAVARSWSTARLIACPPVVGHQACAEARAAVGAALKVDMRMPREPAEVLALANRIGSLAPMTEMPPRPFPTMTIVYGSGFPIKEYEIAGRVGTVTDEAVGLCLAHMFDAGGNLWDVVVTKTMADAPSALHVNTVFHASHPNPKTTVDGGPASIELDAPAYGWTRSAALLCLPWAIGAVLEVIGQPGKPVERTLSQRRAWEKAESLGGRRVPPVPFYEVNTNTRAAVRRIEPPKTTHASPSFRFDVMSHARLYLHRGAGAPDPIIAQRFVRRGYDVLTSAQVAARTSLVDLMLARGHDAPKVGEWFAIRIVQVKAHLKGPENAEYVPALRAPLGEVDHG